MILGKLILERICGKLNVPKLWNTEYGVPRKYGLPRKYGVSRKYGLPRKCGVSRKFGVSRKYGVPRKYGVSRKYGLPRKYEELNMNISNTISPTNYLVLRILFFF